jgi:hypothetical protein
VPLLSSTLQTTPVPRPMRLGAVITAPLPSLSSSSRDALGWNISLRGIIGRFPIKRSFTFARGRADSGSSISIATSSSGRRSNLRSLSTRSCRRRIPIYDSNGRGRRRRGAGPTAST